MAAGMVFVVQHTRDFGDYVAAALNFHPVANLHSQPLDLVHVVERSAAHCSATDGNRLQRRDRGEFAGASDLNENVLNLRDSRSRCVLVRNRPSRGFAGETKLALHCRAVDLDYNSVYFVRKRLALFLPRADEFPDFIEVRCQNSARIDLETRCVECIEGLRVPIEDCAYTGGDARASRRLICGATG